jgi:hypothetical protein
LAQLILTAHKRLLQRRAVLSQPVLRLITGR